MLASFVEVILFILLRSFYSVAAVRFQWVEFLKTFVGLGLKTQNLIASIYSELTGYIRGWQTTAQGPYIAHEAFQSGLICKS